LIVSDVTNPPTRGNAGFSFWVNNTIENDGTGNAKSSTTYYLLSLDNVIDLLDVLVGSRSVSNLKRGAIYRGPTWPVTIPIDFAAISPAPAYYYLLACADGPNSIPESNENNNCAASAATIYVLPAVELKVTPTSIETGGTVEVAWTEIANPSAYAWIALFIPGSSDADPIPDTRIYVNCDPEYPTDPVAEGSCPFTIPNTITPGPYELRLFAGPISASASITVTPPPP
jgi:hypothetical protein